MIDPRPTRQRVALADLALTGLHQHVRAEEVHQRATQAKVGVLLATPYNALAQFRQPGLLHIPTVDASHCYSDADTSDHHHLFPRGREAHHRCPFERHQRRRSARAARRHSNHPYRRGRSSGDDEEPRPPLQPDANEVGAAKSHLMPRHAC
ncbi:transcriptional repressor [Mesorhizobium sp. M0698]|uniref:transcriptional repressor n=1 Tax=Mesorhizobium sp. M0698 TaxID=2956987 RepID=UPI003334B721